jgi:uncharacterized membrane protein
MSDPRVKPRLNSHELKGERGIYSLFLLAIIIKGLDGALEIALAAFLAFSDRILPYILSLANDALIENPNDFFATHFSKYTHPTHSMLIFAALYLLAHGTVKLILTTGLWLNKMWAYPAALGIISIFIVFQLIRVLEKGSILLLLLTIFDCLFVFLIWYEYKRALARASI